MKKGVHLMKKPFLNYKIVTDIAALLDTSLLMVFVLFTDMFNSRFNFLLQDVLIMQYT